MRNNFTPMQQRAPVAGAFPRGSATDVPEVAMKHKPSLSSMSHANAVAAVCTGKVKLTAEVAKRVASHGRAGNRRSAYRCNQCGAFHIGDSIRPKHLGRGVKNASHARRRQPLEAFE